MWKKTLPLILAASLLAVCVSCSSSSGGSSGPDIPSTWTGSYSGSKTSGTVVTWQLLSGGTMAGTWLDKTNSISITVNGTYTLSGETFTFSASGTAYNTTYASSSTYSLSGSGTLGNSSGSGTFTISFGSSAWSSSSESGTWTLTKS
jgi:hypothetical protein